MDRANTRQPSLLSPHTERRGQTAEIGDFHNAFLYSCACSVSSMHTTGFPFGDRIRCTCQNKYRCTLTVLSATRHGRRHSSISTGTRGACLATQRVCFGRTRFGPCQSRTIKVDERWLRLATYVIFIEDSRHYLFRYDYPSFSFFSFKRIRKIESFFIVVDVLVLIWR